MKTTEIVLADVVVGVDGTEESVVALKWALDHQKKFGPVRTVTAYQIGPFGDGFGFSAMTAPGVDVFEDAAKARARKSIDAADPTLTETAVIIESPAGPGLVKAAANAGLLVVGCRGRSGVKERLLGSVGSYCVKHATVPVAVIAGEDPRGPLGTIAVGIDGSDNARAALRWAIDHVDAGGTVIAVGSFNPFAYSIDGYVPPIDLLDAETRKTVEDSVADVVIAADEVKVEVEVHNGDPRSTLREAGEKADLLVVGSRGHRGVGHLLLGSVTTSLLHHPTCVTVVVPN